eukprot:951774_1
MSFIDVLQYINLGIIFTIAFPIFVASLQLFYKHQHKEWIRKRHKSVLIVTICIVFLNLFVLIPLLVFARLHYGLDPLHLPFVYSRCIITIMVASFQSLLLLYMMRVWILYFDSGYSQALSSKTWSALINPQIFATNWFIANKHIYGNTNNIFIAAFVANCILIIVELSLYITFPMFFVRFIVISFFLIAMSLCYQMWKSFPMFQDAFGIQYELLYFMKRFGVLMIFIIISQILSWKVDLRFIVISNFCYVLALVVLAWSVIGIPSYYNEIYLKKKKPLDLVVPMDSSGCNIECELWEDIILNIHGFNAFMEFLQTEFMTQYLLFVTEYAQLIKVMATHDIFMQMCKQNTFYFRLAVSEQLPLSTIVEKFEAQLNIANDQDAIMMDCFLQTANQLHSKYILATAPLVLNIDGKLQETLNALFIANNVKQYTNNEVMETLQCLQDVFGDIRVILDKAYRRFRRSDMAHVFVAFLSRKQGSVCCSSSSASSSLQSSAHKPTTDDSDMGRPSLSLHREPVILIIEEDPDESMQSDNVM